MESPISSAFYSDDITVFSWFLLALWASLPATDQAVPCTSGQAGKGGFPRAQKLLSLPETFENAPVS